jgi:DNA-directed RNA polymerase subunit RPC12/RpoP
MSGMPYKLGTNRTDVQKQIDAVRKSFEDKLNESKIAFEEALKKEAAIREQLLKEKEVSFQETIKKEVKARDETIKEKQEEIKKEVSSKESIQKMLDDIKGKQKDNVIDCPTCGLGHVHRIQGVKGEEGKFKCTGPDCNEEYVLVDPASDYKCVNCGLPHKKPKNEDLVKKSACPFCKGTKMAAYDWKAKFDNLKKIR